LEVSLKVLRPLGGAPNVQISFIICSLIEASRVIPIVIAQDRAIMSYCVGDVWNNAALDIIDHS